MKQANNRAVLDLTSGPALPLMLRFCLPILAGNLMQQFYNMADAAVVGKLVGTNALAAVGATGALTFLVIGFVNGICAGFCIPAAQAFGQGNRPLLRQCVAHIVLLAGISAVLLTAATSLLLDRMLTLMAFPPDIYADAHAYLRVIFAGIPATIAYNTQEGLMRAMGNSRTPLFILMGASVTNILLDLLLVGGARLGVRGAAIATIASQILAAAACFVYIRRVYPDLRPRRGETRLDGLLARRLILSGLPMALQYSITAVGSVLIQTAVNGLSTTVIASVTAANKVQTFVHLPFSTLGVTISTFVGQNMGARRFDRVKDGFRSSMKIAVIYSIGMGAFMFFCGAYVSLIFLDRGDPRLDELLSVIREFLRINCLFYIPLGVLTVCRFTLQGMEHGVTAMFAGAFEMAARAVVATVFASRFGFRAVCFANPAAWIAACVLLVPACAVVFRKAEKKTGAI
ncbi:MAG: MATE family efflux transporter [Ruminococcaceae bacterium]|jgi:putative MATE family efflux protein|nr:MATE family efflux transporter [Oscillospiraceae bacterium]